MRRLTACGFALLLAAPAAARAEETYEVNAATCGGVYGALADTRGRMSETFPAFAGTNLNQIDYAARRYRVTGSDPAARAGQLAYETQFKVALTRDIIDRKPNNIGAILKLSVRCDFANNFTPTFTVNK